MTRTPAPFSLLALVALAAAACQKPARSGPLVAEGKGIAVTQAELEARIAEQPPLARQAFTSVERKKQLLDNVLRFELLARAAEQEGLAKDPEVQYAMRRVLVAKYYQRFFQDPEAPRRVTDAEVAAYFDAHPEEFKRPARVHALHLFLASPAGSPDRGRRAAEARALLARILEEEKKNPGAFLATARERSEDAATKPAGGDLGPRTAEELAASKGKPFADAVAATADGTTSPTVVETEQGLHLLRVLGRQPAWNRTVEEARPQITARLASEKRTAELEQLVDRLRKEAGVKVDEAALLAVKVPQLVRPVQGGQQPGGLAHPASPPPAAAAPPAPDHR